MMQISQVNPYASPRESCDRASHLPTLPIDRWSEINVQVSASTRGWWKRRVTLTGSIDAEIEYDPRGSGERVLVNRKLVATTSCWNWDVVVPHIDFFLEANGYAVPASIDVKASILRLLRTTAFRLTVAGRTVYEDRNGVRQP